MRALGIIAVCVVALIGGAIVLSYVAFPTYTHRFRLTVEVETPEGVKSGSSVMQSSRIDNGAMPLPGRRFNIEFKGEAVFVDLGQGRNLVALLGFGQYGGVVDRIGTLALEAWKLPDSTEAWATISSRRGPVELTGNLIPTLITFADRGDPKTASLVRLNEFGRVFGAGTNFRRAWIEVTDNPVTWGVEANLPWVNDHQQMVQASRAMRPDNPFGASAIPDMLFLRRR
jgi:hypothetical protein